VKSSSRDSKAASEKIAIPGFKSGPGLDELLVQTFGPATQHCQKHVSESEDAFKTRLLTGAKISKLDIEKIPIRVGRLRDPDLEGMGRNTGTGHSGSSHLHLRTMTLEGMINFLIPIVQGVRQNHAVPDPVDQIAQDSGRNAGFVRASRRLKKSEETEEDQNLNFHGPLLPLIGYE
jgi:hypothetical protein